MGISDYERIENGEKKSPFNDKRMRDIAIEFFKQVKGINFTHGTEEGIDLIGVDDKDMGAEGENGGWCGNRWDNGQADFLIKGTKTLNIQDRKWHYWNLQELSDKPKAKKWYGRHDPGWNKNWYFRLNTQEDQICLVSASTILSNDENKRKFVLNRWANFGDYAEDWICILEEFVETYNKQPDGQWVLNGKYWGPTKEECTAMYLEEKKIKAAKQNARLKELKRTTR